MPSNRDVLQRKVSCLLPHGAGANPWNFCLNFPDAGAALWLESLIRWGISVFVTIFLTAEGVPSLCPQICSLERVRTLWWGCLSPWLTKGRNLQKGFNSTESHSSMAVLPRGFLNQTGKWNAGVTADFLTGKCWICLYLTHPISNESWCCVHMFPGSPYSVLLSLAVLFRFQDFLQSL